MRKFTRSSSRDALAQLDRERARPPSGGRGSTPRTGRGPRRASPPSALRSTRSSRSSRGAPAGIGGRRPPAWSRMPPLDRRRPASRGGRSRHCRWMTLTNGTRRARRSRCASSRSSCPTPARSTELLPTPLGPYTSVSSYARRFSMTMLASRVPAEEQRRVLRRVWHQALVRAVSGGTAPARGIGRGVTAVTATALAARARGRRRAPGRSRRDRASRISTLRRAPVRFLQLLAGPAGSPMSVNARAAVHPRCAAGSRGGSSRAGCNRGTGNGSAASPRSASTGMSWRCRSGRDTRCSGPR